MASSPLFSTWPLHQRGRHGAPSDLLGSNSPATASCAVVLSCVSATATAIIAVATTLQASSRLHVPGCATLPDDPHHDDESSLVR